MSPAIGAGGAIRPGGGGSGLASGDTPTELVLADGTFANGAKSAAAAGVLPARITVEDDYLIDLSAVAQINAIIFGSDDASILALMATGTVSLKKYNFAGSLAWSVNVANGYGLWRKAADEIWVARASAVTNYHRIVESTQAATTPTSPTTQKVIQHVPGGTADTAWACNLGTALTEFTVSTGAATGRTITAPASVLAMWCSNADGVPGIYVNCGSAQGVLKYKESDLTLEKTWTISTAGSTSPGSGVGSELIVDSTGRPYVRSTNNIDRFSLAQGGQLAAAERMIWADGSNFGPGQPIVGGGAQSSPFAAFSSDDRYLAFLTPQNDQTSPSRQVRVRNILTQTAIYAPTISSATNLKRICVAGQLGNGYGPYSGWRTATADYRRTRVYYKRIGTDSDYVEVVPNKPLSGVALAAASTLNIKIEFRYGLGMPGAPLPYVENLGIVTGA